MIDYQTKISINDALAIVNDAYLFVEDIEERFGFDRDEKRLSTSEPISAVKEALEQFLTERMR